MKKSARRRVERQLRTIMENNGDNCSICGKAFPHNSKTSGGTTANGTVVLVGECCARKISELVISGLYFDRSYDSISKVPAHSQETIATPERVAQALEQIQNRVAQIDRLGADIAAQGGVTLGSAPLNYADSAWKSEDASWFEKKPRRSHRLRPIFPGEAAPFPAEFLAISVPPDHEWQILVRQVEAGKRLRIPFCRNTAVPIPDIEEVIHALFDVVSKGNNSKRVISVQEVAALAKQYTPPESGEKTN